MPEARCRRARCAGNGDDLARMFDFCSSQLFGGKRVPAGGAGELPLQEFAGLSETKLALQAGFRTRSGRGGSAHGRGRDAAGGGIHLQGAQGRVVAQGTQDRAHQTLAFGGCRAGSVFGTVLSFLGRPLHHSVIILTRARMEPQVGAPAILITLAGSRDLGNGKSCLGQQTGLLCQRGVGVCKTCTIGWTPMKLRKPLLQRGTGITWVRI